MNKEKQQAVNLTASNAAFTKLKPIRLYDHLPGILAAYPAVLFLFFSLLTLPNEYQKEGERWWPSALNEHMLFWVGVSVMIVWYIAFRFNMPKSKFWLLFGLLGTFIGIPVVLELTTSITPFTTIGEWLGHLKPEINSTAWLVFSFIFGMIWLGNFIWSRTHMRVKIDESGLTINRIGGKGERFDLIGLKTENEPLDYLELFIGGFGSISLKTRMNKPIFSMKRVSGLYRIPIFPFFKGKLIRIEEMLTYQGKVLAVDPRERMDIAEALDAEGEGEVDVADGADERDDFDAGIQDRAESNQNDRTEID